MLVLVGLIFVGARFFGVIGAGPVPVEIHYLLGPEPTAVEVALRSRGTAVASFETSLVGPDVVEKTRLPAGDVDLEITLVGAGGARRTVGRTIQAERGAVIRIDLSRETP